MKLKIYSLVGCPYSLKAERLTKTMKIKNEIIKVRGEKEKLSIKKKLRAKTFPQIYIVNDKNNSRNIHIGGCDNFEEYLNLAVILKDKDINLNKLKEVMKLIK